MSLRGTNPSFKFSKANMHSVQEHFGCLDANNPICTCCCRGKRDLPKHRTHTLCSAFTSDRIYKVRKCEVVSVTTRESCTLGSLWNPGSAQLTLLVFFTHWCVIFCTFFLRCFFVRLHFDAVVSCEPRLSDRLFCCRADLGSWELAQRLNDVQDQLRGAGAPHTPS
jgi:hypothetical protein